MLQDQLIKIQHHIPVHRAKLVVLRVVAVLNLLLVHRQEQQIERVLVVLQEQHFKIPHHIQMFLAKRVLLRAVLVLNF